MTKRGQASGAGAATLVLILTIMIILYIVFLPSADRTLLLGNDPIINPSRIPGGVPGSIPERTLLLEHPGKLDFLAQKEISHTIPTINLYTTTAATELKTLRSLYVKNGWFDEVQANFTFSVVDLLQTDKVTLTFNKQEGKGRLSAFLNGALIFQDELSDFNIPPIELPRDLLQQTNQIVLMVNGVGVKFWSTNEYRLEDIKITADVTDASTNAAREVLVITKTERENMERATMRFFADCVPGKVGVLILTLNGHQLFSGVPDCGVLREMEISPANFIAGENTLSFMTEKGVYLIDQLTVRSELKEVSYPTYYFDVEDSVFTSNANIVLYLDFVDDVTFKAAQVFVNGKAFSVSTRDNQWWSSVSRNIQPGTNAIEIIPRSSLDVVNLEVVLE